MGKEIVTQAVDSWQNFLTGLGLANEDKRLATSFKADRTLAEAQLRALYREDLAKQIVEIPVMDMTSAGFDVDGDPDRMVVARMEETGILKGLRDLLRWSKVYGGALGVIGADDGQKYDQPLNPARLRNITHLHPFHRHRVIFTTGDLYQDPANPKFGTPQFYRVTPISGHSFIVHESRTVRIDGAPVDDITRAQNWGWGDSVYQNCYEALRQLAAVFSAAEFIVDDFSHGVYGLKNLGDLLSEPDGEKQLLKRFQWLAKTQHVSNDKIIDADQESYTKVTATVAGLPDLLDRFMLNLSARARLPASRLFGRAVAGMNATGEFDDKSYNKMIAAEQAENYKPVVEILTKLIFQSRDGWFEGKEPERWTIKMNPITPPSAKEEADLDKVRSDEVIGLINAGVLDPNEVRALPDFRDRFDIQDDLDPDGDPTDTETDPTGEVDPAEPDFSPSPTARQQEDSVGIRDRYDALVNACRRQVLDARGRRRGDAAKFVPQTIVLSKEKFPTAEAAQAWAKKHGFATPKVDETQNNWRLRQRDPGDFSPGSFRTITPTAGVEITLGRLKGA